MWKIQFTNLEKQDERHPLIICFISDIIIRSVVTNSGLSCFKAKLRIPMFWQSESGQDIAISVYDILWNGPRIWGHNNLGSKTSSTHNKCWLYVSILLQNTMYLFRNYSKSNATILSNRTLLGAIIFCIILESKYHDSWKFDTYLKLKL